MKNNAGFFSPTPDLLKQFSETMIKDMPAIDILASWRYEEAYFSNELQKAYKIDFEPYNPFWSDIPWTVALENRKVLVERVYKNSISVKSLFTKTREYYPTLIYKQLKRFKQLAIILTVDSRHGLMPLNS